MVTVKYILRLTMSYQFPVPHVKALEYMQHIKYLHSTFLGISEIFHDVVFKTTVLLHSIKTGLGLLSDLNPSWRFTMVRTSNNGPY